MLASLAASRAELEASRQRFHDFASASSDWLWETDRNGVLTYVSPSVTESLGFAASDLVGRTFEQVFRGDDVGELMSLLHPARGVPQPFKEFEVWLTSADGHRRCLRLNGVPILQGETFAGFRGTARDITKLKQDESLLMTLANQDPLTGLYNRRRFMADLTHELRRAERTGRTGALMLIDLDHIKLINDTAGHAAGDEVIVQVAGMLRRLSRGEDLVARLSGDEFALAFAGSRWSCWPRPTWPCTRPRTPGATAPISSPRPTTRASCWTRSSPGRTASSRPSSRICSSSSTSPSRRPPAARPPATRCWCACAGATGRPTGRAASYPPPSSSGSSARSTA